MTSVKAVQRETTVCILLMKRRSSAHQLNFTHTPTSYFKPKATGDKKSASKNKASCNKHSSQLLQKITIYKFKKDNENTVTCSKS